MDADEFCRKHGTEAPVYILCQSGGRASTAAQKLTKAGHANAVVVQGGINAAMEQGIAVVEGESSISMERQVRTTAGSLALVGTLAGAFFHPAFLLLPAFVGAGLAFSGITNTCGMARILAKCPWNR